MIVMMTTLLFGTFMKPVQRLLIPPTAEAKNEYAASKMREDMIIAATDKEEVDMISRKFSDNDIVGLQQNLDEKHRAGSNESFEEMIHPNLE
jgi:hypothetical protein